MGAGARPVGFESFETLRIEAGIPRYGVDVAETNVVLESGLDEAISYTKGCYIGQEIIARIHWRGHVAKQLAGVLFETDAPVQVGAQLVSRADGKEAGRITSAVASPQLNRTIALAMIRYAYLAPGTELQLVAEGEAPAHVARIVALPFVRGSWSATHEETTREATP
jgi:aminomethyltransferase